MDTNSAPFWKDEPEQESIKFPARFMQFYKIYAAGVIMLFVLIPAYFLSLLSIYWGLLWLGFFILVYALLYYLQRIRKSAIHHVEEIQKQARETIHAQHIGSAIHVAGHPLLQREQPVVLALAGDSLNLYAYERPDPLDTIPVKNIQGVYTVAYDDERVPHLEAIDSAAQALQVTFLWRDQPCTCLFRRMRKVKPIDWYHAIQQARLDR